MTKRSKIGKKSIRSKVMTILVIAVMLVQLTPMTVWAVGPTEINGPADLYQVRNNLSRNYILKVDIDLSDYGTEYGGGAGWEPIGTEAEPFTGTFNGDGHTITGLYINRPGADDQGLFGVVDVGAVIENVSLAEVDISGDERVGGLAGSNNGTISDSSVAGDVTGSGYVAGGLVGWNKGSITGSSAAANVTGDGVVGGLAGRSDGTVSDSCGTGEITSSNDNAGGLIGLNFGGSIARSYATGSVTGMNFDSFGGLVGGNIVGSGIADCYASGGAITGPDTVGGLVGYNSADSSIASCYANGAINGDTNLGGLVGINSGGSITGSYFDTLTTGQNDAHGGDPKATDLMISRVTYVGWNFDAVWTIREGETYPYFQWQLRVKPQGEGTSSSPYLITEPGNLIWMSKTYADNAGFDNLYFKQTANIDMSSISDFLPIGDDSPSFRGYYDGSDHKISGLTIDTDLQYVGLFGSISSTGKVQDLALEDVTIRSSYAATGDYLMIGGIAGVNLGLIQNCHITESAEGQSLIAATNSRHVHIGGMAGSNDSMSGAIMICSNAGDVSAGGSTGGGIYAVGGIAGYNYGTVENNLNTGSVSTADSVASLIYVGGIIGDHAGGSAAYCLNLGVVALAGSSGEKGGIVGFTTSAPSAATVQNNVYLEGLAALGINRIGFNPGTSEGAAPKPEAELKTPGTYLGWDTEKWVFNAGSYPVLKLFQPVEDQNENSNDGSGSGSSPSKPKSSISVTINGQIQQQAATVNTVIQNGRTNTVVTLDTQKTSSLINSSQPGSKITVPVDSAASDTVTGVLNGELIKAMENKQTTLEIRTSTANYTLPAQQIDISSISQSLGQDVKLSDIKVQIEITKASDETVRVVENSAKDGSFSIVVPPVEFNIACTYGEKTVNVSRFNAYVERAVAIPEGVDPQKITTGIVVEPDGTYRHVPTQIIMIDGKYYAKINSLTNSTYSVIWNPVEFPDAAKHWARAAINDMGSRMVVSGDENGNFAPNRDITRAEFAAIVVRALGLTAPGDGENQFADVKGTAWYSGSVSAAYKYGIINGYENDMFKPQNKITREQAMTMIGRAMCITGLKTMDELSSADSEKQLAAYSDAGGISKYAKSGIAACIESKVVNGKSPGRIAPKENITRAEVAVIIKRLLEESDLI